MVDEQTESVATAETATTKRKVADKVYLDGAAEESRHANPDAVILEFRFAGADTVQVDLAKVGPKCTAALAWHGLAQKLGDAYSKLRGADAQEALEKVYELLQNDEWMRAREGAAGPRISIVIDAIVAFLEANGETVDEARKAAIKVKVPDAEARKKALANPGIQAQYDKIRAERAAEKAAKSAADAAKAAAEGAGEPIDF